MKEVSVCLEVAKAHCPKVDQNKRFLKMVRINITFKDGGGWSFVLKINNFLYLSSLTEERYKSQAAFTS